MSIPCTHLADAAKRFAGYDAAWFFCGGTALDLFMGRVLRPRHDIDIGVFRGDQVLLWRHFVAGGMSFVAPATKTLVPWDGAALKLPVHELYASTGAAQLEILLNESHDSRWIYRRDARISMPIDQAIRMADGGLPYLAPEIVLLFKSKHMRPQDEVDFGFVREALSAEARRWLQEALRLTAPGHAWLQH